MNNNISALPAIVGIYENYEIRITNNIHYPQHDNYDNDDDVEDDHDEEIIININIIMIITIIVNVNIIIIRIAVFPTLMVYVLSMNAAPFPNISSYFACGESIL